MRYESIFWDWNGTLFNDTALCHGITNELLKELEIAPLSFDAYRKSLRHPISDFFEEITQGRCKQGYAWFSNRFHKLYEERRIQCRLHGEVEDLIAHFKEKKARQSILSAHPQPLLEGIVAYLNIRHHFEYIIGAGNNLAHGKLDEGVRLMNLHKSDPKRTLLIGDTHHDAEVAEHLGIDCVIVAQGFQCKTKLGHIKFPVKDSFKEVLSIL